jgi:hypothetical protein
MALCTGLGAVLVRLALKEEGVDDGQKLAYLKEAETLCKEAIGNYDETTPTPTDSQPLVVEFINAIDTLIRARMANKKFGEESNAYKRRYLREARAYREREKTWGSGTQLVDCFRNMAVEILVRTRYSMTSPSTTRPSDIEIRQAIKYAEEGAQMYQQLGGGDMEVERCRQLAEALRSMTVMA